MRKVKERRMITIILTIALSLAQCVMVLAADEYELPTMFTSGLNFIKNAVLALVAMVGVVYLALGLMDFGSGVTAHDGSQQMAGIKKAGAGFFIAAVPSMLLIFTN